MCSCAMSLMVMSASLMLLHEHKHHGEQEEEDERSGGSSGPNNGLCHAVEEAGADPLFGVQFQPRKADHGPTGGIVQRSTRLLYNGSVKCNSA